jgi:hypothetical protein
LGEVWIWLTVGTPSVFWPATQGLRAAQQQCPSATQHSIEQNSDSLDTSVAVAASPLNRSSKAPTAARILFIHICRRLIIDARYPATSLT